MSKRRDAAIDALKQFYRDDDRYMALSRDDWERDLFGDSDRAAVILLASWIEDELRRAILSKLRPLTQTETKALFGPDRPLGSFAAKINIGYALELYDKTTRNDLDILREMRNACAHSRITLSFETKELIDTCFEISMFRENLDAIRKENPKVIRTTLVVIVLLIIHKFTGWAAEPDNNHS